jgi:PD-(D/E)XK nuclease superfamily
MSIIKLSHTAKELYLKSPRAYFYHYHLYLREKTMGSPLFFGSLVETGLDVLFKGGTVEQAKETFKRNFQSYTINGTTENLSTSKNIRYSKADLDLEVFTEKEIKELEGKNKQFISHLSLQRKGEMLIEAYHRDILPQIKKVVATQKYFSIKNDAGDEINGFLDIVCELKDGSLAVLDHKTSSMPAKEIIKNESYLKQVSLYVEAIKDEYPVDLNGFIVLEKKMRKKEPKARVELITQTPDQELMDKTLDEFDDVIYNIKQGQFPCATPKCDAYGQECCYKKYCQSGGTDLTGLVKIGKK